MKITKKQLKQIIKEEVQNLNEGDDKDLQAFDAFMGLPAASHVPAGKLAEASTEPTLREPWDGIETNAGMISDNALKIEYLARKLGIEIPVDPKL
tara:strand:+ start:1147 stop:1431 length:285 start_codon:yes stop_codon:yes gene_type:complete